MERGRPGSGRRRRAARGAAGLRRRDRAEDAGARRRDRRRLPDALDHDARVRPLHARERPGRHRHRLHGRRLDRPRPRRGPRRSARDRGDVPGEQGAEHPGRADTLLELAGLEQDEIRPVAEAMERGGRLAAKARGDRRHPRQVQADRGHARGLHRGDRGVPRRRLHARDARAVGRQAARADRAVRATRCCRTSDDRPRPPRRARDPARLDPVASPAASRRAPSLCARCCEEMGLHVQWQQVEDGRANVLGTGPAPAAGRR